MTIIYYGLPAYQLMKLQRIQNVAARLVFQESKYCHITPIIRGIRKYVSKETTEILIHAFISSRVDYCNRLYYGLPAYQLMKLQRSYSWCFRSLSTLASCEVLHQLQDITTYL